MANSYVEYTGDASTTTFNVTFSYISTSHVKVYLDGVATTAFSWLDAGRIDFSAAPGSGVAIKIARETPVTSPLVTFTDGPKILAKDLNNVTKQAIYAAEEKAEYADTILTDATAQATAAAASATSAATAKTAAETAETNAETAETNAETAETNAAASATAAAASASAAATSKTAAEAAQGLAEDAQAGAETAETNAAGSATAAAASAATATTQAGIATAAATAAAADAVSTAADAAATAADLVETAADVIAAEAAKVAAETAQTNAETAETNAAASAVLAGKWATEAEDVEVTTGLYSAYHWAQKAQEFAAGAAVNITFTPYGNLAATNVQAALQELDDEKAAASHAHAAGDITSGTFADARVAQTNVTQHQAALSLTESQISDLGAYITGITGEVLSDLSDVTITTIAAGELLTWNGSAWINQTLDELKLLRSDATAVLTKGFTGAHNLGTKSSNWTVDPTLGNLQYMTNGGAHAITVPASDCFVAVLVTNGASAGALTFSGFTNTSGDTGDDLTTTNGHDFIITFARLNGISSYKIWALQ